MHLKVRFRGHQERNGGNQPMVALYSSKARGRATLNTGGGRRAALWILRVLPEMRLHMCGPSACPPLYNPLWRLKAIKASQEIPIAI